MIRTLIVAAILCGGVFAGFQLLMNDQKQRMIDQLEQLNAEMEQRLAQKQEMIERLSATRRIAHVVIDSQRLNPRGNVISTDFTLIELDDEGSEIARQSFTVPGDVIFLDVLTVKFEHDQVAQGNPLAGRTLVLLRRVYSEAISPAEGFSIDLPGAAPPAYATSDQGRFEQQLWEHFWELAVDPELAESMGVRVAQGEAVYKPVRAGQVFEFIADADGGVSLIPIPRQAAASHGQQP